MIPTVGTHAKMHEVSQPMAHCESCSRDLYAGATDWQFDSDGDCALCNRCIDELGLRVVDGHALACAYHAPEIGRGECDMGCADFSEIPEQGEL